MQTFPSDLEIARQAKLKPLPEIADGMGIGEHLLEPYGDSVAKIKLEAIEELESSEVAKKAFGDEVVNHYLHTGRWEQYEYDRRVTDWEVRRLFERI
jgi:glutamine synthetase